MYDELIRKVGIQNILTQKGVIFIVRIEQFQWFQRLRGKNYNRQKIERKDIKVKKKRSPQFDRKIRDTV